MRTSRRWRTGWSSQAASSRRPAAVAASRMRFLPRPAGFFVFRKVVLGGDAMSLYALENEIIRGRFREPRVHFALNCASASCPLLPRQAFRGADLFAQLEREAQRFFSAADTRSAGGPFFPPSSMPVRGACEICQF